MKGETDYKSLIPCNYKPLPKDDGEGQKEAAWLCQSGNFKTQVIFSKIVLYVTCWQSSLRQSDSLPIIDVYESRDIEDAILNIEAYRLLEYFWAHEPCYLRYDYDPMNSKGSLHPINHLDINISVNGSYKVGLKSRLSPDEFEDIVNKSTDCYYLIEKLPSHMLILKGNKKLKKKSKRKKAEITRKGTGGRVPVSQKNKVSNNQ